MRKPAVIVQTPSSAFPGFAVRRLALMAGDVAGGCRGPFPGGRGFRRRIRRGRWRRGHIGNHLIKQGGARSRQLLLAPFAAAVRVLGEARLANDLCHILLHHAGYRMVQQKTATWAVVIDQVAKAFYSFGHERPVDGPLLRGIITRAGSRIHWELRLAWRPLPCLAASLYTRNSAVKV